jgi:transposase
MLEKDRKAPRQHPYLTVRPPRIGRTLYERQEGLPDHVLQIARRAQSRLYRIHRRMRERKKPSNVITVACARELACFLWADATAP